MPWKALRSSSRFRKRYSSQVSATLVTRLCDKSSVLGFKGLGWRFSWIPEMFLDEKMRRWLDILQDLFRSWRGWSWGETEADRKKKWPFFWWSFGIKENRKAQSSVKSVSSPNFDECISLVVYRESPNLKVETWNMHNFKPQILWLILKNGTKCTNIKPFLSFLLHHPSNLWGLHIASPTPNTPSHPMIYTLIHNHEHW